MSHPTSDPAAYPLVQALMTSQATLAGLKALAETEAMNGSGAWTKAIVLIEAQIAENRRAAGAGVRPRDEAVRGGDRRRIALLSTDTIRREFTRVHNGASTDLTEGDFSIAMRTLSLDDFSRKLGWTI